MRAKLNDRVIESLKLPERGSYVVWDSAIAGFGVRVSKGGAKAFLVDYRNSYSEHKRVNIGAFPTWRYGQAKTEAQRLKRDVDLGFDPLAERRATKGAPTFADVVKRFDAEHLSRLSPATQRGYRHRLKSRILPAFGAKRIQAITPADVRALHAAITADGAAVQANVVHRVASSVFAFAKQAGLIDSNPAHGSVKSNREHARERFLSGAEQARLADALADLDKRDRVVASLVRLLLLCGSRLGETLQMKWADIDLQRRTWTKPPTTTKGKRSHTIPLSAPALQVLSSLPRTGEHVFASHDPARAVSWQRVYKRWRWVRDKAQLPGVRLHDLRHSAASMLISSGAGLAVIARLLGHASMRTSERYAHLADDPLRAAVDKLGDMLSSDNKPGGEVVKLKR